MVNKQEGGILDAPYFQHAYQLWQLGLCPIPCGGEKGKRPLREWKCFQNYKPFEEVIEKWQGSYGKENIGILTGDLYNLTVLDFDYQLSCEEIFDVYGHTPIIVETPRGGKHAYYAHNGEQTGCLKNKTDIRGRGGLIIAPPSVNHATGMSYNFMSGGWGDIARLPQIAGKGCLDPVKLRKARRYNSLDEIKEGGRNNYIFHSLLKVADGVKNKQALINVAYEMNVFSFGVDALPPVEVEGIAKSVWKYVERGALFVPEQHAVKMLKEDVISAELTDKEFRLLAVLKLYHFEQGKHFAICPEAMEKLTNCSAKTIRASRTGLVKKGYIKQTYKGGKHKGDVSLFRFLIKGLR